MIIMWPEDKKTHNLKFKGMDNLHKQKLHDIFQHTWKKNLKQKTRLIIRMRSEVK